MQPESTTTTTSCCTLKNGTLLVAIVQAPPRDPVVENAQHEPHSPLMLHWRNHPSWSRPLLHLPVDLSCVIARSPLKDLQPVREILAFVVRVESTWPLKIWEQAFLVSDSTSGHRSDQESLRSPCSTTERLQCTMSPCQLTQ